MKSLQPPAFMRLLPPDLQSRFARRRFPVRGIVKGRKTGHHRSPLFGSSTEFSEHREYSPGDDPRNLDWRVFGKMDRYCIRQYVEETNLRATILLDTSASMQFAGLNPSTPRSPSRLDYARHLAALMSYLFIRQGDAAGLICFSSTPDQVLPPRSTTSHLRLILQTLHAVNSSGASATPEVLHHVAGQIPRRGLIIVISDFLTNVPELLRAIHHLRHRRNEVILFHVLNEDELTFPVRGSTRFTDPESAFGDIDTDADAIRAEYLRRISNWLRELEDGCHRIPCDYVRFNTSVSYEADLNRYLAHRAGG